MEYAAVSKLKAGQSLYMVKGDDGIVLAMHVERAWVDRDGYPTAEGVTWMILDAGSPPFRTNPPEWTSIGFAPCDGHMDIDNHRVTTSKKQAIRWAREAYAIHRGVWAIKSEFTLRFAITAQNPEDQAKLDAMLVQ